MVPAICLWGRLRNTLAVTNLKSITLRIPANSHTAEQVAVVVDTHSRSVEVDSRHSFAVVW